VGAPRRLPRGAGRAWAGRPHAAVLRLPARSLGDPDVLQEVPRRRGDVRHPRDDGVVRESSHGRVERMRAT
jgi:hypothetical protein